MTRPTEIETEPAERQQINLLPFPRRRRRSASRPPAIDPETPGTRNDHDYLCPGSLHRDERVARREDGAESVAKALPLVISPWIRRTADYAAHSVMTVHPEESRAGASDPFRVQRLLAFGALSTLSLPRSRLRTRVGTVSDHGTAVVDTIHFGEAQEPLDLTDWSLQLEGPSSLRRPSGMQPGRTAGHRRNSGRATSRAVESGRCPPRDAVRGTWCDRACVPPDASVRGNPVDAPLVL